MKALAALAVFLFVGFPVPGFAVDLQADPGGFFGIKWETPIGEIPQLEPLHEGRLFKTYMMPGAAPLVGGVQLEKIVYRFYKGRLESVQMRYRGRESHRQISKWASGRFGPIPFTESRAVQQTKWLGPETSISLQYNGSHGEGVMIWTSRFLETEIVSDIESGPVN